MNTKTSNIKTRYRLFSVRLMSGPLRITIKDVRNNATVVVPAPVKMAAPDVAMRYLARRGIHVSAVAMIDPDNSALLSDDTLSEVCLLSRNFETPIEARA